MGLATNLMQETEPDFNLQTNPVSKAGSFFFCSPVLKMLISFKCTLSLPPHTCTSVGKNIWPPITFRQFKVSVCGATGLLKYIITCISVCQPSHLPLPKFMPP